MMDIRRNGVLAQLNMSRADAEKLLRLMRAPGGHCDWCEAPVCHGDCPMHELDMLVARLPEEPKQEHQPGVTKDLLFRPGPGEKPGDGVDPC